MKTITLLLVQVTLLAAADWPQDGGNAGRTGWTQEEPALPWRFAWTWNGPDAHRYHQPRPHEPWEARVCAGGGLVFAPAGALGLYALRMQDGGVAWHFTGGTCHATPAFDAKNGALFVGTTEGGIVRLDAKDGRVLGRSEIGAGLDKALLLAGARVFALTNAGVLHCIAPETMQSMWRYATGSAAATLPAWSEKSRAVVFCTADMHVHCVGEEGKARWKTRPAARTPPQVEFTGGWPVIADEHGIVFVRLAHTSIETTLWSGGGPKGKWPATNAAIRARLVAQAELQNLFALRLADGGAAFIPAVGPAGVEDMHESRPRLRVPAMPVVRRVGGREVAYVQWRNGGTRDEKWDGRWDSHLGEMMLDDQTVSGLAAGDVRFVKFAEHGGWMHITDESCPLTMAGDTIFQAHWDASSSARVTDRSPGLGLILSDPIQTEKRPPVARHIKLAPEKLDPVSHWHRGGMTLVDGRYLDGPGWWVYANVLDPPTPVRNAYSEGILPRQTIVSDGHIIVQGNGGDLFVLRCGE